MDLSDSAYPKVMDCPKCGFTQPNDRYCAKCGIDVEAYHQKPPGFFTRLANNSNLHLGVIVLVVIATLAYLVISQRELIQKEVGRIFPGLPLLSHSAMDEETSEETTSLAAAGAASTMAESMRAEGAGNSLAQNSSNDSMGIVKPEVPPPPPTVEVRYMEVAKENTNALVASGQVMRELENWRVVYLAQSPSIQSVLKASRPLPGSKKRALPPQGNLEILSGDYDPNPNRSFLNFSMIWKMPNSVDWSLITQLPNQDQTLVLREFEGKMKWAPGGALLMIFDPLQRIPVAPDAPLSKSPLRVLKSSDFQNGLSDLIIWIEVTNLPVF